ncbi:MAG: hypothetical protein IH877_04005 [Gemmatimonadetes bacterium]|nr:hypothetical protein [Gemmatimonadota bacterium]
MRRILRFLTKPRGRKSWSIFLWSTAGAALLGIPIVIVFPKSVPLVWLAIIGIPANSPLGPVMPTLFEPFVMEVAKYNAPLLVTTVATGVYVYMEFVNWHVYGWILNWDRFNALPEKRWIKWGVSKFARFPFMTILFFAATPVPFWVVRCLAILKKYPLGIFLVATAIGRFPRFYMYAWLGDKLLVPTPILLAVAFGTAIILVTWKLLHGRRMLEDTILDK